MQMSHQHHHQLTGKVKEASQQPRQSNGNLPPQQHYIHQPMSRIMVQQDQQFQRAQQMQFAGGTYSHPTGTVGDQDDQRMDTRKEETAICSGDKKEAHSKQQVKHGPVAANPVLCVRPGCTNLAIANNDWDGEYCSNRCVVAHCRDVFATCFNDSNPH